MTAVVGWAAEVAAWMAETASCGRCGAGLVRDPHVLGSWLSDRERPVRGLCPDGEPHKPAATEADR